MLKFNQLAVMAIFIFVSTVHAKETCTNDEKKVTKKLPHCCIENPLDDVLEKYKLCPETTPCTDDETKVTDKLPLCKKGFASRKGRVIDTSSDGHGKTTTIKAVNCTQKSQYKTYAPTATNKTCELKMYCDIIVKEATLGITNGSSSIATNALGIGAVELQVKCPFRTGSTCPSIDACIASEQAEATTVDDVKKEIEKARKGNAQ